MASGGVSGPFIRYPIATSLIMVGILFVGVVSFLNLPVAPLPQIDFPTIQVSASLPGASPETMASNVAQPLERQFAQIPGVTETTSTSGLGVTTVVVQFDLDRNIDGAANDIQAAINAAGGQLPKNLPSAADLSKGQSRRQPDYDPLGDIGRDASDRSRRQRRHQARATDQPNQRRRTGQRLAASKSRPSGSSSILPNSTRET